MKNYVKGEVKRIQEVLVSVVCDECKKVHECNEVPNDWIEFSSHHDEWGNDSVDSYKYYLACSPQCYKEQFKKAVKDLSSRKFAEVQDMDISFARKLAETF